jgi:glycerophosphoryl diester phosphodiesterase
MRMSLHRGASRYAPENTLPAFELAARLGADFIEFDVRAGQDGTHFLLHDGRLNRTTDGQGPLADQTAETIARLSAGAWFGRAFAETRVPTFETFLAAFPGRPAGTARARTALAGSPELYCDAKSVAPERLVEALRRHSRIASTVVYQSAEYLARLRAIEPALRRMPPLGRAADLDGLLERVEPYAVDTDWDILSAELIARCHARGVRVFSDALGDHERIEDYRRAIGWGIDLIQTDHPLRVLRAIELWAAEKKP